MALIDVLTLNSRAQTLIQHARNDMKVRDASSDRRENWSLAHGGGNWMSEVQNHYLNMYYLTSHVDFTDYVQNDAVELENKEKVTIVLNPKVEQKHNMFYTNSTI